MNNRFFTLFIILTTLQYSITSISFHASVPVLIGWIGVELIKRFYLISIQMYTTVSFGPPRMSRPALLSPVRELQPPGLKRLPQQFQPHHQQTRQMMLFRNVYGYVLDV